MIVEPASVDLLGVQRFKILQPLQEELSLFLVLELGLKVMSPSRIAPPTWRKNFEDIFVEIRGLDQAITRRDELRNYLKQTLEKIGLKQGEGLRSERLGFSAKVVQAEQQRIDRAALMSLGVSLSIIEMATVTRKTRPHLRLSNTGQN